MLDDLELFDKSDVQSQNLSGGMKRKLRYREMTCMSLNPVYF